MVYILNFNRHSDSVSVLTTQFFRTEPEAMAEATRLAEETDDMATVQILELDTATLEATEVFSVHYNCEEAQ
jgi:hypothetical protein